MSFVVIADAAQGIGAALEAVFGPYSGLPDLLAEAEWVESPHTTAAKLGRIPQLRGKRNQCNTRNVMNVTQ